MEPWTVGEITQFVLTIGFPSACLYFMGKWVAGRVDRNETAANKRIETLEVNLESLQKEVRSDLVGLVKDCKNALTASTTSTRQALAFMKTMADLHKHEDHKRAQGQKHFPEDLGHESGRG
jgi:hypothetical protein